ncbi:MAG TPA: type 1 glutamine amidotransferase [Syntrophales bacterium]|nr:type 1 glutamine amidotransferase [Syntrophales bacterium]HOL58980.1 type 1 glutamine amidotransferase [Syntrophales bacterium]HPO34742.1 type 1 glutamine amidotransferase [Syntrophales bacterium]
MRVHFFQHDPVDAPGFIEEWFASRGYDVTWSRFYDSLCLPPWNDIDVLIVLGGPMSANDEMTFPWLTKEKSFIREAARGGKTILGICLGAQLIASALGAKVYKSPAKEIGWFTLKGVPVEDKGAFSFPSSFYAFQWHEETFDLPQGAILLATNHACKNQAFQWGRHVIGLQFHLEVRPQDVKVMTDYCLSELTPSLYIQSLEEILSVPAATYKRAHLIMEKLLSYLTKTCPGKRPTQKTRASP